MIVTFRTMVVSNPNAARTTLKGDINKITLWADKWLVRFKPLKSESLVISRNSNMPM